MEHALYWHGGSCTIIILHAQRCFVITVLNFLVCTFWVNYPMLAMLSTLQECFYKHGISAATCLKLMVLTMFTVKQEANAKACC